MYLSVPRAVSQQMRDGTLYNLFKFNTSLIYVFECTTISLAMALAGWSWLSSAPASALQIPEIEPAEAAAWRAGLQLSQLEQHYPASTSHCNTILGPAWAS